MPASSLHKARFPVLQILASTTNNRRCCTLALFSIAVLSCILARVPLLDLHRGRSLRDFTLGYRRPMPSVRPLTFQLYKRQWLFITFLLRSRGLIADCKRWFYFLAFHQLCIFFATSTHSFSKALLKVEHASTSQFQIHPCLSDGCKRGQLTVVRRFAKMYSVHVPPADIQTCNGLRGAGLLHLSSWGGLLTCLSILLYHAICIMYIPMYAQ